MKVGILTFHHAANYGAVWQVLCLCETVRNLGHTVEVIDFRHPAAEQTYRRHNLRSRNAPFNLLKAWRLGRDLRNGATLSPKICRSPDDLRRASAGYDAVIVGSDEVWNIEGMRGWTPAYFLDFVPDHVRKISYAASTGHKISTTEHGDEIRRLLERFHAISVRDQTSADVVEELTGRRPCIVLDPTLLPGRPKQPVPEGKHVTLYGSLSKPAKDWLRRVGVQQGIDVISVGFSNRMGGRIRIQAGLDEWLNTIGSAPLVITTTFHGTLACVLHQRSFWVLPRPDKATKVQDFLDHYGLTERVLNPEKLPDALDFVTPLNYSRIWDEIMKNIQKSKDYLRSALDQNSI